MRLFMATLSTETNTFCAMATGLDDFRACYFNHGGATRDAPNLMTEALHVWRRCAEALGWEVTESLSAIAEPAGRTAAGAHAHLRDLILADLAAGPAPDIVLLQLHGAMLADGEDDCEGDLVERIRAARPDAVIGVSLDLHCHLSDRLLDAADLVVCFKEYPHDDAAARAEELFELAREARGGRVRPVMAAFDCRMVALYLTKLEPMRGFVAQMQEEERRHARILSVSLAHGFPWADLPDVGARVLVVADADETLAEETARRLGLAFYGIRERLRPNYPDLEAAIDRAAASAGPRPVILADMSDNPGAGAPGDSTFALSAVLSRRMDDVALGLIWDPGAVARAVSAGEGARCRLSIGGKAETASGPEVEIEATVGRIGRGHTQRLGTSEEPLGTLVRLQGENGLDVVVSDLRTQVYHPKRSPGWASTSPARSWSSSSRSSTSTAPSRRSPTRSSSARPRAG